MHKNENHGSAHKEVLADHVINQKHLHDMTTLMAELKRLLVRHSDVLQEEGVRTQIQQLENWLESERSGPAPKHIISESAVAWLSGLRDQLKLSADETQRLEGEGGSPISKEQVEKVENLLKTIRRIDRIIDDSEIAKQPH